MKASGNAISLAPLAAASSIKAIVFLIEASRSSHAGAACTTATLYFGCSSPIAASSVSCPGATGRTFPVDRRRPPMQSVCRDMEVRARLPRNKNSTAADSGPQQRGTDFAFRHQGSTALRHRCDKERTHADPVHDRGRAGEPATGALAGYCLRRLCSARLQVGPWQRLWRIGDARKAWPSDLLGGFVAAAACLPYARADRPRA